MKQAIAVCFLAAFGCVVNAQSYTDTYVVGGRDASPNEFPYQVSIEENGKHICSGAIIKENYIVTAAKCICDINGCRPFDTLKIVAGVVDLDSSSTDKVVKAPYRVYLHKDFHAMLYTDDIAVIQVSTPFDLTKPGIKTIAIKTSAVPEQTKCSLSGWGSHSAAPYVANSNLATITPSVSNYQTCSNIYDNILNDKEICAEKEGTCFYDPGAGFVCDDLLAGILCMSYGCDEPNPVVITAVFQYQEWIQNQLDRSDCTNSPILYDAACIDA